MRSRERLIEVLKSVNPKSEEYIKMRWPLGILEPHPKSLPPGQDLIDAIAEWSDDETLSPHYRELLKEALHYIKEDQKP